MALITGADRASRSVAVLFAKEGARVAISYLNEHKDAEETRRLVEEHKRKCIIILGDIGDEAFCEQLADRTASDFGKLDILVNNAAEQHPRDRSRTPARSNSSGRSGRTSFRWFSSRKPR